MLPAHFDTLLYGWMILALILFPVQYGWITAPYGRHSHRRWGWMMDNRLGWVLMEAVSLLAFSYFFWSGSNVKTGPLYFLFTLWLLHYVNRSFIYPLRTKTSGKQIPVLIVAFAITFNSINGWSNGYALGSLSTFHSPTWWWTPQCWIGSLLFFAGALINIRSDNHLLSLRKPGEKKYSIPRGGLFRYVSCPNHFGEIVEWTGFAVMCWNPAAVAFALWTAANLIPRAKSHHQWYQQHFSDYPKNRKAVIPFLL